MSESNTGEGSEVKLEGNSPAHYESISGIEILKKEATTVLDRLSPGDREFLLNILSIFVYNIVNQLINYAQYTARKMLSVGVDVNVSYDIQKTPRGAVLTVAFEVNDIKPRLIATNVNIIARYASMDRLSKQAFTRILTEISRELLEEGGGSGQGGGEAEEDTV